MIIERCSALKPSNFIGLIVFLVTLGISAGKGAPVAVSTEAELFSALWDASVTDIILSGDVHVRSSQLWSHQVTTVPTPRPSPSPWASLPAPSNRPVPIDRQLQIRGNVSSFAAPESYLRTDAARNLRLPLLDLSDVEGWLRLFPNATLRLRSLHLSTNLSAEQPDLRPYRTLLRALLAPPPLITVDPDQQLLLTAVSLEDCLESVNVGLTQGLAEAAIHGLPTLPDAVAAAAKSAAEAATAFPSAAWAALPSPADATVQLQTPNEQLCVVGGNSGGGSNSARGPSETAQHRRAQEALLGWPLGVGPPEPEHTLQGRPWGTVVRWLTARLPRGFMGEALCWLTGRTASTAARLPGWAYIRLQLLCPRLVIGGAGGDVPATPLDSSWTGGHTGRMALSESSADVSASALKGGASCMGGSVLVGRVATAMGFQVMDHGSRLVAVTDGVLVGAWNNWANRTAGGSESGGYGHYSAGPAISPVLLLLLVANSFSASLTQVDDACWDVADGTVAACIGRTATMGITERFSPSPIPPSPLPLSPPSVPVLLQAGPGAGSKVPAVALWVVAATAGVLLVVLVPVVVLYIKLRRLQRRHIQEQGAQRAPGVGPLTTLLVTDIANSTGLWESLPEEVMDQALKLHNTCMRALLVRFNGYESTTEGDSFILAFHYPADAAKFALSAQVQLMDVMWPAEVLAHPDGQEVWVVPRSAELANGGSLRHVSHNVNAPVTLESGGATGTTMSVQRSSGAIMDGGGAVQRTTDVGYGSYGGGGGSADTGAASGFLRANWVSRVKSPKVVGVTSLHAIVRTGTVLLSGAARSLELDRMSPSELDAGEMGYGAESRTGSGLLRSFTSRMTTMLGLVPTAGSGAGSGAMATGGSGRPSSRMSRLLRMSSGAAKSSEDKSSSVHYSSERRLLSRLPASGGRRRGGVAAMEVSRDTMRSKSFGGRLLAGEGMPAMPPRPSAVAGPGSGSHGIAVAAAMGTTQSTCIPTGSFTSGAHSLLRQALSFRRRQGSFRGPSRAAAEAAAAAAMSSSAIATSATAGSSNIVPGVTPVITATTITAPCPALPASVGSPGDSRYTSSYLPPDDDSTVPVELATRRVTGQGASPSSCDSVIGGGGGSASNSNKGGLFLNGLMRLGRGPAISAGGASANRAASLSSNLLRTFPAGSMLAMAGSNTTSGPTAVALAMSSDGRRRRPVVRSSGSGGVAPAAAGSRASAEGAGGRVAVASPSGGYQCHRGAHTHGLYGDVVAGVAYGSGVSSTPRQRASYDGPLTGIGTVMAATGSTVGAMASMARETVDGRGGLSASQVGALGTAYESEVTTGPLFTSTAGAGSSNASGCLAGDEARRLSNVSTALVMDALEANGSIRPGGAPVQSMAPRVPHFRSLWIYEGARADPSRLSWAALQQSLMRRSSAPADMGSTTPTAAPATASQDLAGPLPVPVPSLPRPSAPEADDAGEGGDGSRSMPECAADRAGPAPGGGIGRFRGRGSIGDAGGAFGAQISSSLMRRRDTRGGTNSQVRGSAAGAHTLDRSSLVVNHNQLYGTDSDMEHVQIGSALPASDSIKLLHQHDDLVAEPCLELLQMAEVGPAAAHNGNAKTTGTATGTEEITLAAAGAAAAGGSSPLPASLEVAGTGSGREGHKMTSTTVGGSGSLGLISSDSAGPRSFLMLPSRTVGSPGVVSPTSGGGGVGGGGGGSSLSAALARLMRSRGRETRMHRSPTGRSAPLDSDVAALSDYNSAGMSSLAPTQEPNAVDKDMHPHPQPNVYLRRQLRASSSGTGPETPSFMHGRAHAAIAGNGRTSEGHLQAIGGFIGSSGGIGSYCRGSVGTVTTSPVAGHSPTASRTGSMTFGPISQTVARSWSRANILVRQLTRDRSISRAARSAAAGNTALDISLGNISNGVIGIPNSTGDGDDSGGRTAASGGVGSGAASGLLLAASARLAASDPEADSGAELSAIGILADGLRSRVAAGSVSVSGAVCKMHALFMASGGGAGSGDERQFTPRDLEGGARHRLSTRMVTIDLGAALATSAAPDEVLTRSPGPASAKFPESPSPPPTLHDPKSKERVGAVQLQALPHGGGGESKASARGRAGPISAPPKSLANAYVGVASRRISFLGLGLAPRSRTVERRSSATEEWQTAQADVTMPWLGGTVSQTGALSQSLQMPVECRSWRERCREDWPPAVRPAPPARCAYRGLRVRMGLHTGIVTASDVTFNPTTSAMAYGGTAMKVVKAVGDAAAGGMILMSQSTFQALVSIMMDLPGSPQAIFSGESDLDLGSDAANYCLYQLVHRELVQRIGYSAPLRNIPLTQLGTEDAPTGFCAISFMHVASASMLVAELGQPGVEALQQFKSIATGLCSRCGGYVVEASEGLCLAAFRHAAAALVWALASREALTSHPWSAEVRRWYRFALANNFSSRGNRGPRPRTGVHVGGVNVEVNAATGRMTYRGKVMNRTSRIAHKATSEQIVCSKEAWDAVEASLQRMVADIQEEQRREDEALRKVAAAAARGRATSSTVEGYGDGNGDDGFADDDMVSELGGGGGGGPGSAVNSIRALSPATTTPSLRLPPLGGGTAASTHGSPASTRASGGRQTAAGRKGSLGSKAGSAPPSARSTMVMTSAHQHEGAASDGVGRIKASALAVSLAASVRAHRSASAKQLSAAAAAAAAALSRRVTSFTIRGSANSFPELMPAAAAAGLANGSVGGPVPSVTIAATVTGRATGPASANRLLAALARVPSSPPRLPGSTPQMRPSLSSATVLNPVPCTSPGSVGGGAGNVGWTSPMGRPTSAAVAPNLPLAFQSVASEPAPAGSGGTVAVSITGGDGGGVGSPPALAPSLRWQALSRLVGPKVQLPVAKRLEARYLGSYSLKGVREDMKLFEVFWGEDEDESIGGSGGDREGDINKVEVDAGGGDGAGRSSQRRATSSPTNLGSSTMGIIMNVVPAETAAAETATGVAPPSVLDGKERMSIVSAARVGGVKSLPQMSMGTAATPNTASPTGGFSGGTRTIPAASAIAAPGLAMEAEPVAISSPEFWRTRSGKSDWQTIDTGCSVYDEDITGGVLQPADMADTAAASPAAAGAPPIFHDVVPRASTAGGVVPNGSFRIGGIRRSENGRNNVFFPAVGDFATMVPELERKRDQDNGDVEDDGGIGGGAGGGGIGGQSPRAGPAGSSGAWQQKRQVRLPPFPSQLLPQPSHLQQQSGLEAMAHRPSAQVTIWPVPAIVEPPFAHIHGSYPGSPTIQQQQQQQHDFPHYPSQQQIRPRSALRHDLQVNVTGQSVCSGTSPGSHFNGSAGDISTSSNASNRRRHPAGTLGVTFADPPLRELNQVQLQGPHGVSQRAIPCANRASRNDEFQPGAFTGQLDVGVGLDRPQAPEAAIPAPAKMEAPTVGLRPLSAPTPVRVLSSQPASIEQVMEPQPVRPQPLTAWGSSQAALGAEASSSRIVGDVHTASPSLSLSPPNEASERSPRTDLKSDHDAPRDEGSLHHEGPGLSQGRPLNPGPPQPSYGEGIPWAYRVGVGARNGEAEPTPSLVTVQQQRRAWEGTGPATIVDAAGPVVAARGALPPTSTSTQAGTMEIEEAVEDRS
ncbi:hypothetical protein VaNZ11_011988 [Volvox africanus]|uniref:Guanylate cyclase domain-containing protein n=1 Tax=Volvox africanus TaxID=51714 RepID=A0ABQ5SCS3_9CHLO|nr:hypothetical protein VaNZ11_011988 [Volvox africanus]